MPKIKVNMNRIEMKLGMCHYGHKSFPYAKFEFCSSFSFGDMTSQHFPRKKATSHQIRLFTPEKRVLIFLKKSFYVQNRSSRPKIDTPMSISAISKQRKIFSLCKFLGRLDEK